MVGIANTVLGFSIIVILMSIGVSPIVSNMIGYGLGAILSFYLNSKYTFNTQRHNVGKAIKFFIVLIFAYLLNYFTLQWTLDFLNPYFAQLISAGVYTLSSFFLMRYFIFAS
jgi:putative flippase GtrA